MAVAAGFFTDAFGVRNAKSTGFYTYRAVSGYSDNIAFVVDITSCTQQGQGPGQVRHLP
jgi:hypothetical protein